MVLEMGGIKTVGLDVESFEVGVDVDLDAGVAGMEVEETRRVSWDLTWGLFRALDCESALSYVEEWVVGGRDALGMKVVRVMIRRMLRWIGTEILER